jgi:hypothetical protein
MSVSKGAFMIDSDIDQNTRDEDVSRDEVTQPTAKHSDRKKKKSLSMHDGIAVWCDCCSCEAEPYWAELAEEMGIDLGSDYEERE